MNGQGVTERFTKK